MKTFLQEEVQQVWWQVQPEFLDQKMGIESLLAPGAGNTNFATMEQGKDYP